ncbi:MAG: glycosyltransferase family 4 protein [Chitinophagaceae bacterium]
MYPYIQELINKYSIPIICNTHNVEWLYLERLAEKAHDKTAQKWLYKQAKLMKNVEIACFKKAAIVFACSAVDAALIKEMAPAVNVIVLPNGVDDSLLIVDDAIKRQPNTLLFTGNFNYEPNINGITLFLEHIFPIIQAKIPDTTVVIAGRNAGKQLKAWKNQKGIQLVDSPESMLPYYNAAAVFIAPLWEGSGTRLKIVEAMQMECALISTEYAAEGLPINHNKQALIANDYQNFAEAVILCLHNPELRQKLIKEAKKTVKEGFTWKVIESQLYNSLQQIN